MCSCGKFFCEKYLTCGRPGFKNVTHCIFDMDGTLMNSEDMYHTVVSELCAHYGKEYPSHLKAFLYGRTDQEICETLKKELELKANVEDLVKEMGERVATRLPECPIQIGAERLIKHLHDHKIPIAIGTNSLARDTTIHIKSKPEFFAYFLHMVTADDVASDRGKPFPDLYLVAASKFPDSPKPEKCLVFEDTGAGVQAAKAAGMQVVMTPHAVSQRKFGKDATLVINTLLDFKPELFGLPKFPDSDQPDTSRV